MYEYVHMLDFEQLLAYLGDISIIAVLVFWPRDLGEEEDIVEFGHDEV